MYNRYIPSADGSYICQPVAELPHLEGNAPDNRPPTAPPRPAAPSCLSRLLPSDLEADDILILLILLLLFLDRDGEADSTRALLAAAAFLILR